MKFIKDQIIVLKKQPFSESDLIVRGLNTKGCQISFIAKGAVKSKKRFAGAVLDPTAYIGLEYRPSKKSLHFLQEAWFLEDFSGLRKDYSRLSLAFYFLAVMLGVSQEGTPDTEELFHLLGNALKEAQNSPDLDSLKIFFQIKILFLQGILSKEFSLPEVLEQTLSQHNCLKMNEEQKRETIKKLDLCLQGYLK